MQESADSLSPLFQSLRTSADLAPDPGFYSRVLERVQASRSRSMWAFSNTDGGRHLVIVLCSITFLLGTLCLYQETRYSKWQVSQQREVVFHNLIAHSH